MSDVGLTRNAKCGTSIHIQKPTLATILDTQKEPCLPPRRKWFCSSAHHHIILDRDCDGLKQTKGEEKRRVSRAAKMLIGGATLLAQPCPYCGGVRVLKDGDAFCTKCGQEPEKREIPNRSNSERHARRTEGDAHSNNNNDSNNNKATYSVMQNKHHTHANSADGIGSGEDANIIDVLEDKLKVLSEKLASETDSQKEIKILDSIGAVLDTLQKARGMATDRHEK